MRHANQAPVKRIPILSREIQMWLYRNDRTNLASYSPGYTGDKLPNHRRIVQ